MEETFSSFVENKLINFIETSSKSTFSEVSIQGPGLKIFIKKSDLPLSVIPVSSSSYITLPQSQEPASIIEQTQMQIEEIKSSWVGLFNHNKEAVNVGDKIMAGQLLGTVICMNLHFDVISPVDGIIAEILVNQDEIVEYGKTLFKISKD